MTWPQAGAGEGLTLPGPSPYRDPGHLFPGMLGIDEKAAVASPTCLITEQRVLGLGLQGEVSSLLQEEWLIDWDDSEPPSAL
ncbi:hypothetical protein Y1Q_0000273 [Alligator mississippiensis]|uniref:Uncharacterized protein n=1 Tax=Alligator mississippiensis TaxID=8496 RepID=A0A151P0G4_ALLMI|nr:hypothetical protein Y1Q_0000273 [Alligator mississippiensis]